MECIINSYKIKGSINTLIFILSLIILTLEFLSNYID